MNSPCQLAAAGLLTAAIFGLASVPVRAADEPRRPTKTAKSAEAQPAKNPASYKIRGHCVEAGDNSPAVGVRVLLFAVPGRTFPIAQVTETVTDAKGDFEFANLAPPQDVAGLDRLEYQVFAIGPNWAIGSGSFRFPPAPLMGIRLSREEGTLSGKVVNARGQAVANAIVANFSIDGRVLTGILSTTTGPDGRFTIAKLPVIRNHNGRQLATFFQVFHRDYPPTSGRAADLPADVAVSLPDGCTVRGRVVDAVTGKPAANAVVSSQRLNRAGWQETFTSTDAAGNFRMVLPEGRYRFLAEGPDRVSVALADRECFAGETLALPPIKLIAGGLISGQVINASTHQPVAQTRNGRPILLGLFGPSHPSTPGIISPERLTSVDAEGRFVLRAAPGENFPYLVNARGDRMAENTQEQPPVIVKEGETTACNLFLTPRLSAAQRLEAAQAFVAALPQAPSARTARLLEELDKQKGPNEVDAERWCTLMQELVTIGPTAVPQICEHLDRTNQEDAVLRLCFALRAIGDPRAVPALIRAIPKTLIRHNAETPVLVEDADLAAFLRRHRLKDVKVMGCDRPVRELFGALHALTGQDFDDDGVERLILAEGRRSQVLQRRVYFRQARLWQTWWEANWNKFTRDPAYEKVHLASLDEPLPPPTRTLSKTARLNFGRIALISPPGEEIKHVNHFIDLDTGYESHWPAHIPRDESRLDQKQLAQWALENGVDLMCVTRRAPDGTEAFVLQAFHMRVWEITPRDVRNLNRFVTAGTLPSGRDAGDLLMHYDAESGRHIPGASGAFLFETREGNKGLIEVPDHIERVPTLPVAKGKRPKDVGFLRFKIRFIIE